MKTRREECHKAKRKKETNKGRHKETKKEKNQKDSYKVSNAPQRGSGKCKKLSAEPGKWSLLNLCEDRSVPSHGRD